MYIIKGDLPPHPSYPWKSTHQASWAGGPRKPKKNDKGWMIFWNRSVLQNRSCTMHAAKPNSNHHLAALADSQQQHMALLNSSTKAGNLRRCSFTWTGLTTLYHVRNRLDSDQRSWISSFLSINETFAACSSKINPSCEDFYALHRFQCFVDESSFDCSSPAILLHTFSTYTQLDCSNQSQDASLNFSNNDLSTNIVLPLQDTVSRPAYIPRICGNRNDI